MSRFIWSSHKPRIRLKTLQIGKDKGGMALPDLEVYYQSAQIRPVIHWCGKDKVVKWKSLEQFVQEREIQSLIGDREEAMGRIEQVNMVS